MPEDTNPTLLLVHRAWADASSWNAISAPVFHVAGYPSASEGVAEARLEPETVHTAFTPDLPEADRWTVMSTQRWMAERAVDTITEVEAMYVSVVSQLDTMPAVMRAATGSLLVPPDPVFACPSVVEMAEVAHSPLLDWPAQHRRSLDT